MQERAFVTWFRKAALFPLLLSSSGCEASTPEPELNLVSRDSSGIQIVENLAPAGHGESALSLAQSAQIRIGAAMGEEEYLFMGPLHAVRLSSGTIVILDEQLDEVRWFDASGQHLLTRGGYGEGPGEFVHPNRILRLRGDSVLVHDEAHPRLTLFDSEGTFVRTWNLETPPAELAGQINYFRPAPFGRLRDRRTLHLVSWAGNEPGHNRRTAVVLAYDSIGRWLGPLAEFPGGDWWVEHIEGGRRSTQNFGDRSAHAASDGEFVYVGNGDDYRIRIFDANGHLIRIVGRQIDPTPADHDQIDEFLARVQESAGTIPSAQMPEFERRLREMESDLEDHLSHYETMPAFYGLAVDQAARLWVRNNSTTFSYDLFESEGAWLGSLTLPNHPLFLGEEEVIIAGTDSLGVPFVELFSLSSG